MKEVWTNEDSKNAASQGWNVFCKDGNAVILTIDDPLAWNIEILDQFNEFNDDEDAADFVKTKASAGCSLALKALRITS